VSKGIFSAEHKERAAAGGSKWQLTVLGCAVVITSTMKVVFVLVAALVSSTDAVPFHRGHDVFLFDSTDKK
jgi:hypothetical protein